MPHVASETKAHSINPSRNFSPRPSQANERARGTSFESMLDETAAGTADRAAPPPKPQPHTKSANADKRTEKSADKSAGKDAATSMASDPGKSAKKTAGKTGEAAQGGSESKAAQDDPTAQPAQADPAIQVATEDSPQTGPAVDAEADTETGEQTDGTDASKVAEQAAAGEVVKPSGDGKPAKDDKDTDADGDVPATPADAVQTGADQVATAIAPVIATPPQTAPKQQTDAIDSDAPTGEPAQQIAALPADPGKAAAKNTAKIGAKPADKLADNVTGKPTGEMTDAPATDDAATADKLATPAPKDAGVQPPSPEAAQKADAHARGLHPTQTHGADITAAPQASAHSAAPKADATQPLNIPAPVQQTPPSQAAAAAAPAAQPVPQAVAVPLNGIAVEIASKALAGKNHFAIRLDPPELGRIDVRLDVDRDGRVTSHLVADRRDTLDLLQRDSSTLQRALQDAGLKTSDNGLQFSLRDQSGNPQPDRPAADSTRIVVEDDTLPVINAVHTAQSRYAARRGGIDIRI